MEAFIDVNNNGIINTHLIYTVDSNGNRTSMTRDTNNDGTFEYSEHYDLNPQGNIMKSYIDNGNDGFVDRSVIYTRDINGLVSKEENDIGNNGIVDSSVTYERNAQGYIISQKNDINNDGVVDSVYTTERDVYGNTLRQERDMNNDGTIDVIIENEITSSGLLVTQTTTTITATGQTVERVENTYNEQNRVSLVDRYINDVKVSTETITYDDQLREIERYFEYTTGRTNRFALYEYNDPNWSTSYSDVISVLGDDKTATPEYTAHRDFDGLGQATFHYIDYLNNGEGYDLITFGPNNVALSNLALDTTTWTSTELDKFNNTLREIRLSNDATSSELTLNKDVLSQIAATKLVITGDATDTITLANNADFTQVASDSTLYKKYIYVDVDTGNEQSVYIDTDINVVLG